MCRFSITYKSMENVTWKLEKQEKYFCDPSLKLFFFWHKIFFFKTFNFNFLLLYSFFEFIKVQTLSKWARFFPQQFVFEFLFFWLRTFEFINNRSVFEQNRLLFRFISFQVSLKKFQKLLFFGLFNQLFSCNVQQIIRNLQQSGICNFLLQKYLPLSYRINHD